MSFNVYAARGNNIKSKVLTGDVCKSTWKRRKRGHSVGLHGKRALWKRVFILGGRRAHKLSRGLNFIDY